MTALEPAAIQRFRALVARRLGLHYGDDRLDLLAEVLRERLDALGDAGPAAYFQRLASPPSARDEWRAIAARLSVPETYFLRYAAHFRAFAEVVLPDRVEARRAVRRLRILSAGCASGEEPYSLAIAVREHLPDLASWDVAIHGVDVNPVALAKAARGRYSVWSLRETPAGVRARYFRQEGRDFVLDDAIRAAVSFEERNLADDDPHFWWPDVYDVVFCRNVVMYFEPDVARAVVDRIARALVPGGYLFLGHAETLRGLSSEFHLRHTHETFYYQRRDAAELALAADEGASVTRPSPAPAAAATLAPDDSWVDAIHRASERIAALARAPGARRAATADAAPRAVAMDLGIALELLREERFGEALDVLHALRPEAQSDPDVLLLRAVLLTNAGDPAGAERVCRQLLARDELNAGAHHLLALCREHAGDRRAAMACDQAAIYLDPAFAMAHLHLGLVARRVGDLDAAGGALGQARLLLAREDASRILLFGGGFSREALVRLCEAELRAVGGAP